MSTWEPTSEQQKMIDAGVLTDPREALVRNLWTCPHCDYAVDALGQLPDGAAGAAIRDHMATHDENLLPTWEALIVLDNLFTAHTVTLRIEVGDFRVWTSRCGLADGEPFEHTVYVEARAENADRDRGWWQDLGHYDGDDPPLGLPGLSPADLRGSTETPTEGETE